MGNCNTVKKKPSSNISIDEAKEFLKKGCGISPSILDDKGTDIIKPRFGRRICGPENYLKEFIPPIGWTAIGLKVVNIYDNGDNSWIGTNNSPGDWYIGYHGVGSVKAIQNIYNEGFRRGNRQLYKNYQNINPLNNRSIHLCGEGVYFTPDINEAKKYSALFYYNNYNYRVVFMCRINPYKVRIANVGNNMEYWIVEGDKLGDLNGEKKSDVVRPYRILFLKETYLSFEEAKEVLVNKCEISLSIIDDKGNTMSGWRINGKSGPKGYLKDYIPPIGWTAIGLKALNLYDNGDNTWIGTNNNAGEWYICYYGIKEVNTIQNIYNEGFRKGDIQIYNNTPNINQLTNNSYPFCGEGVYFMPDIEDAFLNTSHIQYKGYNYAFVLMCRINPYKVRIANIGNNREYWIVEEDKLGDLNGKKKSDVVRPYRILVLKNFMDLNNSMDS